MIKYKEVTMPEFTLWNSEEHSSICIYYYYYFKSLLIYFLTEGKGGRREGEKH